MIIPSATQLMEQYNISPEHSLGQHFMVDDALLERILDVSGVSEGDTVLEVGPGLGVLTVPLARRVRSVTAVELDERFVEILEQRFEKEGVNNVSVLRSDILQYPMEQYCEDNALSLGQYSIVANLPYGISAGFLRHVFNAECRPFSMTLVLQKEVAERAVAIPGDMSMLSVLVQSGSTPTLHEIIPPEAFLPAPEVDSALISFDLDAHWRFQSPREAFFRVAKIGFSSRRKQLHNNLKAGLHVESSVVLEALDKAGIEPVRRAETLTCDEWDTLTKHLVSMKLLL